MDSGVVKRLRRPKSKGDRYERELAEYLNKALFGVRCGEIKRALLSGGGASDGGFDLWGARVRRSAGYGEWELGIEAKRTERLNVWAAFEQALRHRDAMVKRHMDVRELIPMVVTRRSRMDTGDSLVVLRLSDLCRLLNPHFIGPAVAAT